MSASCRVLDTHDSNGGRTSPELPDAEEAGVGELLAMVAAAARSDLGGHWWAYMVARVFKCIPIIFCKNYYIYSVAYAYESKIRILHNIIGF
jgi:hypothetical protein